MEEKDLPLKQQQFCKHYIENKGNATRAYMKAFGTKKYDTAKVEASKLLTKPNILKRINEIMEENGFNNVFIDLELQKMIIQDKYPMAKLRAISEYNKINRRYDENYNQSKDNNIIVSRKEENPMSEEQAKKIAERILSGKVEYDSI